MKPTSPDSGAIFWKVPAENQSSIETACRCGVTRVTAAILETRGMSDPGTLSTFLDPQLKNLNDPFLFADMDKAAARVADAAARKESICIHGDYDADGMTSTALLKLFLDAAGCTVRTFLPGRESDGYGISDSRVTELAEQGISLIICTDCGIKSYSAAETAAAAGVDIVVLDHHAPGSTLPGVCAVVDPHRSDCRFPFKDLAAVGIAFYFCGALRRTLIERNVIRSPGPDIRELLDLVAVGTVADVMPLTGDNRILVKAGLDRINSRPRPGIAALKAVSDVRGTVSSGVISFKMGPRLNATGRMSHPDTSLSLLLASDDREAARYADLLDQDNRLRREVGMFVLEQAREQILSDASQLPDGVDGMPAVVVARQGWHQGVLGIAAARLVEEFGVPAIVLTVDGDVATGSARSVEGFDIGAALGSLEHLLLRTGGHPMAAGLSIRADNLEAFARAFLDLARVSVPEKARHKTLHVDCIVGMDELSEDAAHEIEMFEPFGLENPEPVLMVESVLTSAAKRVGKDGSHLRVRFEKNGHFIDGIWFGGADSGLSEGDVVDVAFCLVTDDRTGMPSMKIKDIRPATEAR